MTLLTFANLLTYFRIILILPFLYFLFLDKDNAIGISEFMARLIAFIIFIVASVTDFFDGYLARVLKEESKIGQFLDPLADKFLVSSALIAFLQIDGGIIPFWMVTLVIFREFLITGLRISALSQSKEVETMTLGKAKTTFQLMTILVILLFIVLKAYFIPEYNQSPVTLLDFLSHIGDKYYVGKYLLRYAPYILMLITTIITVFSGIRYLYKNRSLIIGD